MFSETKTLLKMLCSLSATSGNEINAAEFAKEELSKYMPAKIDRTGNVIGSTAGFGGKNESVLSILLDAHLDQIGLAVTGIDDDGFVKIARVGGSDVRVLTAAEVTIHGKKDIYGVVTSTPPHLAKDKDGKVNSFDEITIDIGMKKEEAEKIISAGDRITFNGPFDEMLNGRIASPSIDDRAGVVAILRCLQMLDGKAKCRIDVQFSAQEETGGTGAMVGAFNSQADEAIAVDVSFATAPGVSSDKYAPLGKGVLIGYSPSLDYEMSRNLTDIANRNNIPNSAEVMGGRTGTNGDEISSSGKGIKTSVLSIPIRNMHTAIEVCDPEDIESTAKLMAEYIIEHFG